MKNVFIFLLFSVTLFASNPRCEYATLKNGIKVIFVKVEENPVISSTVVVKAGLKHENEKINGISHLLEHLVFNGTGKRTQEQLYRDFDAIGCYNNASTSDHYTAYYVLTRKDNFEKAVEIQSDMLFNSVIPENKIAKEKGIVIEEIRKDKMSPRFFEDTAFRKAVFSGTPYSMRVIGSEQSVKSLTRKTIFDFYKTYYSPENTVILIAGDYNKGKVLNYLNKYFGAFKPVKIPEKKWKIVWKKSHVEVEEPSLPYNVFYLVIKGVKADSKFFPYQQGYSKLLGRALGMKVMEIDPRASVSTEYTDDYGIIKIRVRVTNSEDVKTVKKACLELIESHFFITEKAVRELKVSSRADTLFSLERPHFFGMLQAPFIAAGCTDLIYYRSFDLKGLKAFAEKVKKFNKLTVYIKGGKNEKK